MRKRAALDFENDVVLALVQALFGAIDPNIRAISVACDVGNSTVDLHVAVAVDDPGSRQLLDEVITDFDAVTGGSILVRPKVWIGDDWTKGWPGLEHRSVFAVHLA